MALQTRVMVDGVWTTQIIDLQTVLNGNQDQTFNPASMFEAIERPPATAVLTRTVIPSPLIRWIIPARIRHQDHNDVVFVGDDWIQIKELHNDGRMLEIVSKRIFNAPIRHARAFGDPITPGPAALPASLASADSPSAIKREKDDPSVPPHVLVLALDSDCLVFLYAHVELDGTLAFQTSMRALPVQRSPLERVGKHIAIDPKSRAMAVSAQQHAFILYALHPMARLRETMAGDGLRDGTAFQPIREERHLFVDGVILRMEFLHPEPGDEEHVILLLLVSKDQVTRMVVYEWDCSTPLRTAKKPSPNGIPIVTVHRMPLLLIPLIIQSAFLVVSEACMSVYRNVLTGDPIRISSGDMRAKGHHGAKHAVRYTAWTRPTRRPTYSPSRDDIYICRDDGGILMVQTDAKDMKLIRTKAPMGLVDGNVDTAFASLDVGLNQSDVLIAGGSMSPGGIYYFREDEDLPSRAETLECWNPMRDFATAPTTIDPVDMAQPGFSAAAGTAVAPVRRDRVFACAGRGRHAFITELRRGLEARVGSIIPYHPAVNHVWSLPDYMSTGVHLLVSFPVHAELIYLAADASTVEQSVEGCGSGLDLDVRTITAAGFGEIAVQITERSICATALTTRHHLVPCAPFVTACEPEESILNGALHPPSASIITAIRRDGTFHLRLGHLQNNNTKLSIVATAPALDLPSEPTCMSVETIGVDVYLFVATTQRTLHVFRCDATHGLVSLLECAYHGTGVDDSFALCESIVLLKHVGACHDPSTPNVRLVCGLRNGLVVVHAIQYVERQVIRLHATEQFHMGQTTAQVMPDPLRANTAFVVCGPELCQLALTGRERTTTTIHSIWLKDHTEPSFRQGSVVALTRICLSAQLAHSDLGGALVLFSRDQMFLADLDEIELTVPRRMAMDGTPTRILFSPRLNLLAVGYSRHRVPEALPASYASLAGARARARMTLSSLRFFDLDRDTWGTDSSQVEYYGRESEAAGRPTLGRAGEVIYGLLDWTCTDGKAKYHFIVVVTGMAPQEACVSPGPQACGRLLLLTVGKMADGRIEVKQKYAIPHEQPVYAIAAFGPSSLVTCAGTEICLRRLNIAERRWERVAQYSIRSPCLYVSAAEPFIYVTTAGDSVLVFKVEGNRLIHYYGDSSARAGQSHLVVPGSNVVLATDKESTLVGLWHPSYRRNCHSMEVLFEAEMPQTITKLRFTAAQPSWRVVEALPGIVRVGRAEAPAEILGSCLDGSMCQVMLLSEPAWRLLRFMQNLCSRSRRLSPFGDVLNSRCHVEPQSSPPRFRHVNGDVLMRVLEAGPSALHDMLNAPNAEQEHGALAPDFDSPHARLQRFAVLVGELLETHPADPVEAAMAYLGKVLQPLF
ncbi:MAG: hypothetical protein M1838_006006 [Thelocarpon superellum]|nr:MAG: hypothetical protein M1838_006006 [Thelocarpon superellum]